MNLRKHWKLGAAALLVSVAGTSSAGTLWQWGDYHWETPTEGDVTLAVSYKFADPIWESYHTQSLGLWNDPSQSPITIIDRGEKNNAKTRRCPAISGEIMVCSDRYGQTGWVGIAEIRASGTHITQAVVKYNDTYFASSYYDNPEQRDFVTCHEIGHTFGLGHADTTFDNQNMETCMDYTADPYGDGSEYGDLGPRNDIPGPGDWTILNSSTAYGHSHDGGGTDPEPDPTPCRGGPKKCGNGAFTFRGVGDEVQSYEGPYGRAVGYDGQGRPNEFVQDLGAGNRKITFIMWARGHRPAGSINR